MNESHSMRAPCGSVLWVGRFGGLVVFGAVLFQAAALFGVSREPPKGRREGRLC